MDNQQKKKKFLRAGIAVGVFSVAVAGVWLGVSASGKNILAEGRSLAVSSWNEVFQSNESGTGVTEMDFDDGSDVASTSISDAGTNADGGPDANINVPAKKPSPGSAQTSSASDASDAVPVVVQTCNITDAISNNGVAATSSQKIILNEIAWMGSVAAPGETASHASDREWIELKNNSADDVALAGWQLLDGGGNIKVTFAATDNIPPGSFFLLARDGSAFFTAPVDKIYSGSLPNTGDALVLFDPRCAPSDVFDVSSGWPAGSNTTKQTMERDADGNGWHTSVAPGGTPRAENSVPAAAVVVPSSTPSIFPQLSAASTSDATTATPPASSSPPAALLPQITPDASPPEAQTVASSTPPSSIPAGPSGLGHLVIMAVQIGGASSSNDLVKIMNPTSDAVDVSGWKLHKRSSSGADYSLRTFPDATTIAPGAVFVWANSEGGFSEAVGANVSSTETLAADNSVALFDKNGNVVDEVAWGTGTGQYVEGTAYPTDPAAGQVLTRNTVDSMPVDTDDNATDFSLQ